jgi:hypothetical protein
MICPAAVAAVSCRITLFSLYSQRERKRWTQKGFFFVVLSCDDEKK